MRYRLLIPILTLFLIETNASDAEYKFVVVEGEPVTLNASESVQVASFDECTDKCEQKTECVLAYQSNSSDPCYLFDWNSITQIIKNESGGNGTTAFKVYTDQPACELNSAYLLNGKTYPLFPNDTAQNLWRIDTSEDGWTITYIDSKPIDSLVCGNFSYNRPYDDGCNPECNITMVQVWAKFGPLTKFLTKDAGWEYEPPAGNMYRRNGINKTAETFEICMYKCHEDLRCAAAYFDRDNATCVMVWTGDFWFLERTSASDGHQIAIKLPMNDKLCKMTTDQLLDDQYYLSSPAMLTTFDRQFFRVQTTEKYYVFTSYLDYYESFYFNMINGCPVNNRASALRKDYYQGVQYTAYNHFFNETMCYRYDEAPGITQAEAKELCQLMGQKLLSDKYAGSIQMIAEQKEDLQVVDFQETMFDLFRLGFYKNSSRIWHGLEKDPADGKWKWLDTRFVQFPEDALPIPWAPGEPKEGPDMNCAYMGWGEGYDPFNGYAYYAAPCNSTVDGIACSSAQVNEMNIKKWSEVADDFGYRGTCCIRPVGWINEYPE
ncbi:Protein CBG07930 [Caenorhabditis briggsae]|uniref:Protein CBG07930 n=1 Tax=Caenorhabditis briggsae TaxID=6238 RepID=A8X5D9_CAEBR|nr:Protein CBG07930 [Caenorhabditis briggsae]CAP27850.1 Protein CBG07930 [Caenorhabditis briggsae]